MLDYSKIMPTFALFNLLLDKSYGRLLKDYPRLEMSSEWTTLQVGSGLCVIQRIRKLRIVIRRLGKARLYRQLQGQLRTDNCIPASTQANTARRFEQFSQQVCENTGMTNAYPLLTWNEEGEEYTLPTDALQGKDVLLFDDIIASGGSVCRFAEKLTTMGANVIAALALGKKL